MKDVRWDPIKNLELIQSRKMSFEELLNSKFLGIEEHPKKAHQRYLLFEYKKYVWVVPYVIGEEAFFLKTAFPSRKHTKKYLGGKS